MFVEIELHHVAQEICNPASLPPSTLPGLALPRRNHLEVGHR